MYQILRRISHNLGQLEYSTSHLYQLDLSIVLLLDTTEDCYVDINEKISHECNISKYSPIEISSSFMFPTISPFGIDGNIDEKHLVPRIQLAKDCYISFQIIFINHSSMLHFSQTILPNYCTILIFLYFSSTIFLLENYF